VYSSSIQLTYFINEAGFFFLDYCFVVLLATFCFQRTFSFLLFLQAVPPRGVLFFPTHIPAVVPVVKGIQTYGFFFIPPNFSEKKTRNFFIPCSYYFSDL
jgi:hypothetical protein